MKVLKFGGSSVESAENIEKVKKIVEARKDVSVVVVSAFRGITDGLTRMGTMAAQGDDTYKTILTQMETRHLETAKALTPAKTQGRVLAQVKFLLNELEDFLHGVFLIKELTPKALDYILSFGERLSSYIISKAIENAELVDSRELIKTDRQFGKALVDFKESDKLIANFFKNFNQIAVMPGFIASTEKNETTTLGRGGSDYSAAIIAAAVGADLLEIWTDVSGFMNADPGKVSKAYPINKLSYSEAMELSHFGAKVIYTPTIQPVYQKNIAILIKNTFEPEHPGTIITTSKGSESEQFIKGISSIDDVSLLTIQGTGLVGVAGISHRLFGALARACVNVILISQASSEYSITFAISPSDAVKAQKFISEEFEREMSYNNSITIEVESDLSVIAIVGENMKNRPGISATLFGALGKNGTNIVAIAQGSSELNISIVVSKRELRKALNVIHEAFFLSESISLNVFMSGIGTVGGKLLKQIEDQQKTLLEKLHLKINIVGITNTKTMLLNEKGINLSNWKEQLSNSQEKASLPKYLKKIKEMNLRNSIFVDCTASKDVSEHYQDILNSYINIVTANKIANSSSYQSYLDLRSISRKRGVKFLYETNVGAQLPIIRTLSDLINSGDRVVRLEAVLSGTLNFIFNVLSKEVPLSLAIQQAKEKGYSEPDPRIDLSGTDVLRKILILSREAGYPMEQSDVQVKPFLPDECFNASMEEFWKMIVTLDASFEERRAKLAAENKKMRFVARLANGVASIELVEVDSIHPFYILEGTDNVVLIYTERYAERPLIIKGAGAGADVTATGVFADIIRIANI